MALTLMLGRADEHDRIDAYPHRLDVRIVHLALDYRDIKLVLQDGGDYDLHLVVEIHDVLGILAQLLARLGEPQLV